MSTHTLSDDVLLFIQRRFLPFSKFILFKWGFQSNIERFELFRSQVPHLFRLMRCYEQRNLDLLPRFIKPGDTVCDIGASYGVYSREMSRLVGEYGKVVAFEPQPNVMKLLRRHCRKCPNVEYIEMGVSDRTETLEFQLPLLYGMVPETTCAGRSLRLNVPSVPLSLPCRPLDTFYEELSGVSFIKVDIEGHEEAFTRGARRVLSDYRPVVQFEEHLLENLSSTWSEIAGSLAYTVCALNREKKLFRWEAVSSISPVERNFYLIPNEKAGSLLL